MKIVKIKGGLGNQMFQYVFAKCLEKVSNEDVRLDYSTYASRKTDMVRKPRLLKMRITLKQASNDDLENTLIFKNPGAFLSLKYKVLTYLEKTLNRKYFFESNRIHRDAENIKKFTYYDGYWQSWKNVAKVNSKILDEFRPNVDLSENTQQTIKEIESVNSIFIGIRRGDYTETAKSLAHFGIFGEEYYKRAMQYICERVKNPVFYIFSNDIPWVKDNISFDGYRVRYREPKIQTDDFEELMIMSSCKHAIIVNSTYYWWGAWLIQNSKKIIVVPQRWFLDRKPINIIPPNWVRIDTV
jgi:hypothetical protein